MSKKMNAKRVAWQKKEEEKGRKVVNWIFGVLILLGILFLVWNYTMMF